MSRKAKRAQRAKKNAPAAKAPPAPKPAAVEAPPVEPIADGPVEWLWVLGAIFIVAGVSWWFQLDVNRVFDVPKAVILKVGGCGLFAVWFLYALFGPGVRWRSAGIFAGPVLALTAAVLLSTFFSLDAATSFNGVYERQFGLQGFLACVGLFFLTSTGLNGKRGAWMAIGVLACVGSVIGIYALFQSFGWDPWPFFWNKQHNKVYSFLGNATFAGNALALILPMVITAAGVSTAVTVAAPDRRERFGAHLLLWTGGFVAVIALQILPGYIQASQALALEPVPATPPATVALAFKVGLSLAIGVLLVASLLGTWGPEFIRLEDKRSRQAADAVAAGALSAMVIGIAAGLLFTRTRGAWVGTAVALCAGFLLLPQLARGTRWYSTVRNGCWGTAGAVVVAFSVYLLAPSAICGTKPAGPRPGACWLWAETFRSVPAAFDPSRTDYGKGQGTRRYLWWESPRVLFNNAATLERYYTDRVDYAAHVDTSFAKDLEIAKLEPRTDGYKTFDTAWRAAAVWFFGIGIETYRYAFMSHKSLRLEALDPMTNHDNPHNNYLYTLASFGLLGLAAYVWLLWVLLSYAFRRFLAPTKPLLQSDDTSADAEGAYKPGLVTAWTFTEATRDTKAKLSLRTAHPDEVSQAIRTAFPDWQVDANEGAVVVRGYEPDTVLGDVAGIETSLGGSRVDRAMAFGVVTSFFSYAVYSIAGFDSVACSVFLYFLLGTSAVLFRPNVGEVPEQLLIQLQKQWLAFRGRDSSQRPALPAWAPVLVAAICVPLLLTCAWRAWVVLSAEKALVSSPSARTRRGYYESKVTSTREAVRINPYESFYKQSLGNAYAEAARYYDVEARSARGQAGVAQAAIAKAAEYRAAAEQTLYAALDHAWAPENIYISLFQLYYQQGKRNEAETALERALVHSPHLGAVRANLASLQLQRNGLKEALANAKWVQQVDPTNAMAWRVAGRVHQKLGDLTSAEYNLKMALKRSKNRDRLASQYLAEVEKLKTSTTGR